jgi:hypothetical protein
LRVDPRSGHASQAGMGPKPAHQHSRALGSLQRMQAVQAQFASGSS